MDCYLLASDLDGTLIPLEDGPEARRSVEAFRGALEAVRDRWTVAYVTGRHLELALEGMEAVGLPTPDLLACDVGTSLYRRGEGGWSPDGGFAEELRRAMGGADADQAREALAGVAGLELQSGKEQGAFKASFRFDWDERRAVEERVLHRLQGAGVRSHLVLSRDVLDGCGLLDVLPEGGAKDRAVRRIVRSLGLPAERVVFAGDSGNDRAALLGGWGAVLVGNAPDALKEELLAEARRLGLEERLHLARGRWADGVLEGARALGFPLGG